MERKVKDAAGSSARSDDDAAIRQTVAAAERHQNDVEELIALHTTDAIIVNIAGRRVSGREAIDQAMRKALQSPLAKVLTKTEIEDVHLIRPDVAIVSCVKLISDERDPSSRDSTGATLPSEGRLTYVIVKVQDTWQIALAQTTPIQR
jgi:uncharacterized protein (TIGR02246 family)